MFLYRKADSGVFNRHNPYMVPTCLNIGTRLVQENFSGCVYTYHSHARACLRDEQTNKKIAAALQG